MIEILKAHRLAGLTTKVEAHRAQGPLAERRRDLSREREGLKDVSGRLVKAAVRLPQQEPARRLTTSSELFQN